MPRLYNDVTKQILIIELKYQSWCILRIETKLLNKIIKGIYFLKQLGFNITFYSIVK